MDANLSESDPNCITLSVPGGLAGQLFAVGYAAWIASKRQVPVHIQFHHMGSPIGKLGAIGVLETDVAKDLGITFSEVDSSWPATSRLSQFTSRLTVDSLVREVKDAALGLLLKLQGTDDGLAKRFSAAAEPLAPRALLKAALGSTLVGYPTDYRIIEESWGVLRTMISASGYPDFTQDTGKEGTVSMHWRLGDYVQNNYHGAVSARSLSNCLKYGNPDDLPIKLFTDSPDLAKHLLSVSLPLSRFRHNTEVISGDIWSDLYGMTRSKVFIGSHSGVSFMAALALRSDNSSAQTWLPDKWFLNQKAQNLFHQGPKTAEASAFYPAQLVASEFPD